MAGEITTVDVKGLKELDQFLMNLPEQIQRKALTQATAAGARVIRDAAKGRIPVRSDPPGPMRASSSKKSTKYRLPGYLRAALGVWRIKKGSTATVTYGVGARGYAFYGKFLEFGTRFITARPFLRPALDSSHLWAIEAVASVLKQKIEKEIAKQAKVPT
jgi:HK97 gp10 family phage protein